MNRGIDVWGVLPYIRKFNVVIWDCSFDMVGVCMCICYFFEYFL